MIKEIVIVRYVIFVLFIYEKLYLEQSELRSNKKTIALKTDDRRKTTMHCNRMSLQWPSRGWGACGCGRGGCICVDTHPAQTSLPHYGQDDRCKNITFPATMSVVNNKIESFCNSTLTRFCP